MPTAQTFLQQIVSKFPNVEYSTYQSDLYVKHSKEVMDFMTSIHCNPNNMSTFIDNIEGKLYIDVPFGYFEESWLEKFGKDSNITKLL